MKADGSHKWPGLGHKAKLAEVLLGGRSCASHHALPPLGHGGPQPLHTGLSATPLLGTGCSMPTSAGPSPLGPVLESLSEQGAMKTELVP